MKKLILIIGMTLVAMSAHALDVGLSPNSLKLKVYKMAVSTSPLCTNLITVINNGSTPSEVDFTGTPNLGSGSVGAGTYECIVIEFSDVIKFTPSANSDTGACLASTEEELDVCRNPDTSELVDGSTTSCTVGADRVAMYISTGSASAGGSDAFNPPTSIGDALHGFNLGAALVVSGDKAAKFVVNPTGKVCDGSDAGCEGGGSPGECKMEPPTFTFEAL